MASDLKNTINQAAGFTPADFLIKNAKVLNLVNGDIDVTDIAINKSTGMIVSAYETDRDAVEVLDLEGELFAVPGFIDCHVHVESSMVTPQVFDEAALTRGTTTVFCDPHEISNVLGKEALRYFVESSENMLMDMMVGLSSCVPATALETSGATLLAADMAEFIDHPNVYGVSEFMSIGDVLSHDQAALEKLERFADRHIDGHMPYGVTTGMMNALKACGIRNCHENTDLDHAREKMQRGIQVFIREGTVCKDAKTLAALVNEFQSPFLGFCTDDRNPVDIAEEGHIDHVIRTLISEGADVASVYRISSWSAANHFGIASRNLKRWRPRGLIAADNLADIVLLNDLETCDIHSVYKSGELVTPESFLSRQPVEAVGFGSMKIGPISEGDLHSFGSTENMPVIGLIKDQIVTTYEEMNLPTNDEGQRLADPKNDVLYIAVIERHGRSNGNIARGFVHGFGIREGAMAVSIGHDSHNITVVGASHADMVIAVNRVIALDGGKAAVKNGEVIGELALPIAGLMSEKTDLAETAGEQRALLDAVATLGSHWEDPMMMLGFLPLCVIPDAKITDFGVTRFNPAEGILEPVLVEDQRQ
ncbi:MAG: adenine deaminase [Pseudomonadota bacterium]